MRYIHDTQYSGDRKDLLEMIPVSALSVLDIGCGEGGLGELLRKRNPRSELIAIEVNERAAKKAAQYYNRVIEGDIQKEALPFNAYFDCIVCGDVLEHLYDPWSALLNIKQYLKDDGVLIVSLPNIRYYRILRDLVFGGNWSYNSSGILDWSHIRFFTLKEMKKMFEEAGFCIEQFKAVIGGSKDMKKLNNVLRGSLNDFMARQYIFVLRQNKK